MIAETNESVVEIEKLSRRFGRIVALDQVSLNVPRGAVFGLVGENGAGKTTLIKHLMGLLKAESGSVRVFGLDPVREPVAVLARVGFLSEDRDLPDWLRIHELLRYLRQFYPTLDDRLAEDLRAPVRARFGSSHQDPCHRASKCSRRFAERSWPIGPSFWSSDEPSTGLRPDRPPRDPGGDHPH